MAVFFYINILAHVNYYEIIYEYIETIWQN